MAIQTIIFDMDGVLADSEPLWTDIDAAFLKHFGISYAGEHKMHIMGKSFPLAAQFYKQQYELAPPLTELVDMRIKAAATFYRDKIELFPQVPAILEQLTAAHFHIGLATSSVRECALPLIERHDIKKYFSQITTGDEVERGKPYPDIYWRAVSKLGAEPDQVLVIEDSPAGIEAARGAGLQVAAVPDRRIAGIMDMVQEANYILTDLNELPALAKSLAADSSK